MAIVKLDDGQRVYYIDNESKGKLKIGDTAWHNGTFNTYIVRDENDIMFYNYDLSGRLNAGISYFRLASEEEYSKQENPQN